MGTLIAGWREARKKHPELFTREVLVWQSPTATVDSIVRGWQQLDGAVRQNKFRDPGDARVRASQLHTASAGDRHRLFDADEGSGQTLLREAAEQADLESQG